jgi:hypothetical protein
MESQEKRVYLQREAFEAALVAVTHRTGLYLPEVGDTKRRQFQDELRTRLETLAVSYEQDVPEHVHETHIEDLVASCSRCYGHWFTEGQFRWGIAQKALNLYLKHLWCHGWIGMPPHCPIDNLVMAQVDTDRRQRWMRIDNRGIYRSIIEALKVEAKGVPLALWELQLVNRAKARL